MSTGPERKVAERPTGRRGSSRRGGQASSDPGLDAAAPAGPRPAASVYQARQMLQLAHWAAGAFATYDRTSVLRIAEAVAKAAHASAAKYAEWAVQETGFGVVE